MAGMVAAAVFLLLTAMLSPGRIEQRILQQESDLPAGVYPAGADRRACDYLHPARQPRRRRSS